MGTGRRYQFDIDAIRRPDLLPSPTREIKSFAAGRSLLELRDPPIQALYVGGISGRHLTGPGSNDSRSEPDDLFTVVHDTFLSDTARYADIILAGLHGFRDRGRLPRLRHVLRTYGPMVIPPVGESRSNLWSFRSWRENLVLADRSSAIGQGTHRGACGRGVGPTPSGYRRAAFSGDPIKIPYPQTGPAANYFYSAPLEAAGLPPLPEWRPIRTNRPPVRSGPFAS